MFGKQILGTIGCGEGPIGEQNFDGFFYIDRTIHADYALHTKGDSMIDAGIQDGLERYGLQELSDPQDVASVRKIAQELTGTGLMETGMALSMGSAADQVKVSYLRALVEQNFIIIRQLDRITKK